MEQGKILYLPYYLITYLAQTEPWSSLIFAGGKQVKWQKLFGLWRAHSSWKTLPNRLADVMITKREKAALARKEEVIRMIRMSRIHYSEKEVEALLDAL